MYDYLWEKLEFDVSEIHDRNKNRAILMYSGGMDSSVALWWAMDHYDNLSVLIVDYNQPHASEIQCAKHILEVADIPYKVIKVDFPQYFWGIRNRITRGQAGLMTAIAALDISHDGADIIHGILRTDDSYGDCNRSHLDDMAEILSHPEDKKPIGIATPLRAVKNKQAVAVLGFIYGVPLEWTWSCREPINGKPCMNCAQCRQRNDIKKHLNETYGIAYESIKNWQGVLGSPFHPVISDCPSEIYPTVRAFIEVGGLKNAKRAWIYRAPDGSERISAYIRNIGKHDVLDNEQGKIVKCVEVHGNFENGSRWQICICDDERVALTKCLPEQDIIEMAFRKKLVSEILNE